MSPKEEIDVGTLEGSVSRQKKNANRASNEKTTRMIVTEVGTLNVSALQQQRMVAKTAGTLV